MYLTKYMMCTCEVRLTTTLYLTVIQVTLLLK